MNIYLRSFKVWVQCWRYAWRKGKIKFSLGFDLYLGMNMMKMVERN